MSSPRVIVQIAMVGAQIFGKALLAAGRQAVINAKHRPGGVAEEAAGVRNADAITQEHRLTVDEAHLILNAKRGEPLANILKNYELLFKANSPPEAPAADAAPTRAGKATGPRYHSHYLQSKVVRARERIEAEMKIMQEAEDAQRGSDVPPPSDSSSTPPPPPPQSS